MVPSLTCTHSRGVAAKGNALSPLLFSVVLTSLLGTLPEVGVPGGNNGYAGCTVPGMVQMMEKLGFFQRGSRDFSRIIR